MFEQNLERVLDAATKEDWKQGLDWYSDARRFAKALARESGTPYPIVCGVLAALSPRTRWEQNKEDCRALILGIEGHNFKTYKPMVDKAYRVFTSDGKRETIRAILKGPKITAFFNNIVDPRLDVVTVDTHMHLAALGRYIKVDERPRLTQKDYDLIEIAIKGIAKKEGIRAACVQAIIWLTWRRESSNLTVTL